MKCPLMPDKDYSQQLEQKLNPGDCLQEECAWWDKDRKQCSELSKIGALVAINSMLSEIADKLPPDLKARL